MTIETKTYSIVFKQPIELVVQMKLNDMAEAIM